VNNATTSVTSASAGPALGLTRLSDDLSSGLWHERHADLLDRETLDVGYRLLIADL
jgi:hypothetical protein